jgi:hypothetical protein
MYEKKNSISKKLGSLGAKIIKNTPRYVPKNLSEKDKKKQLGYLIKSRKMYKKGLYFNRPKVKTFKNSKSNHVENAKKMYNVKTIYPTKELAKKTKCSLQSLKKIVNKGEGAYYSSGSRPNQTPQSWGIARLASAITGGNSSIIDYKILYNGCAKNSKALKLATSKVLNTKNKKFKNFTISKRK